MRYTLLLILLIIAAPAARAQLLRGHIKAYKRETVSGVPPVDFHTHPDSAKIPSGGKERPAYFIYGIGVEPVFLNVRTIWLEQQYFRVSVRKLKDFPVLLYNRNHTDTLVADTGYQVYQVIVKAPVVKKPVLTVRQKKRVLHNDIVIPVHRKKGGTADYILPKITRLDPLMEQ